MHSANRFPWRTCRVWRIITDMSRIEAKPNIFNFYDYREYLRARYEHEHGRKPWFSYRYIRNKTGINPGFLYKVFQGVKHLPPKSLDALARLFKLSDRQKEYLRLMVLYAKAKTNEELKVYFEKMLSFSDPRYTKVESNSYEYYTNWYYAAVRQILAVYPFKGDYAALAKLTLPPITPSEARKAVRLLEKLRFVKKEPDGTCTITSRHLTTGEDWRAIAIRSFQQQTIHLAGQALDKVARDERDISTVTTMMSAEDLEAARERIRRFRKDIMDLTSTEGAGERVYNINIQLFPISERLQ